MAAKIKLILFVILVVSSVFMPVAHGDEEEETDEDLIEKFLNLNKETGSPEIQINGTTNKDIDTGIQPQQQPNPTIINNSSRELSSHEERPVEKATGTGVGVPNDDDRLNIGSKEVLHETSPCECVKYFLCDIEQGTVIEDGSVAGLIDIRLGNSKPAPCDHYFDICCQKMKPPNPTPVAPAEFKHSACGKRNVAGVGFRITGALDGEAQFGEFPWMAAIVKQEQQPGKPPLNVFVCGASLIAPSVAMTAAHCVQGKKASELKVRLGEWDTQTSDELYPHVDRYTKKIVIHENYYAGALYNDMALLFLDEEVKFGPNIDTVCLPPKNSNFDGQNCYASGWGKDSFGQEGRYQVILKRVEVPIVPRDNCQSSLRTTRLGPYFKLHHSFVCAGGQPGKDTCRGDGGSPLVCQMPNSPYYVQYGIVAWGIGCGEKGTPGVYVKVSDFVDWIDTKMQEEGLDTKYYKHS